MTAEPIPYDELLAAHQEVLRQRDLARRVAVQLEQELAQLRDALTHALGILYAIARKSEAVAQVLGVPLRPDLAEFIAKVEVHAALGPEPWEGEP